jgi:hypothetical protein
VLLHHANQNRGDLEDAKPLDMASPGPGQDSRPVSCNQEAGGTSQKPNNQSGLESQPRVVGFSDEPITNAFLHAVAANKANQMKDQPSGNERKITQETSSLKSNVALLPKFEVRPINAGPAFLDAGQLLLSLPPAAHHTQPSRAPVAEMGEYSTAGSPTPQRPQSPYGSPGFGFYNEIKMLNIQLDTENAGKGKVFACISSDTSIENTFALVQRKVEHRIAPQKVRTILLRQKSVPDTESEVFEVSKGDADRWKMCVSSGVWHKKGLRLTWWPRLRVRVRAWFDDDQCTAWLRDW